MNNRLYDILIGMG